MVEKPIFIEKVDQLTIQVFNSNQEVGQAAAIMASEIINLAIVSSGKASIILATGNSQLTFLSALRREIIDWSKVNIFHMDEYIGIDPNHPASFPNYMKRHLLNYIQPKAFFPLSGQNKNANNICKEYEALLRTYPADFCALGIGENGHLAFNDPPFADFNEQKWVKVVKLDNTSRMQQVREGHFTSLNQVPTHAITLTIPALLAAKHIFAIVPEARKSNAVYHSLTNEIDQSFPATILRKMPHANLFLDLDSAARIIKNRKLLTKADK